MALSAALSQASFDSHFYTSKVKMADAEQFNFRIPWNFMFCFGLCFEFTNCSTHWVVTEDGKVQAQMDSVYSLRHPYDLVALIQQEARALLVDELKEQLIARKEEIDRNEDKETNLEEKLYLTDADCVAAGKPLTEFDLYLSTVVPLDVKGLNANAFISSDVKAEDISEYLKPNCTEIYHLEFSMHAFEHLLGVRDRRNLNISAEEGLSNAVTHIEKVDLFGHLVYESLQQNKTSWVLYNLATYYWRMKGDANNAIECVRRALHFSPREYKDVSLVSLGNILHRANYCEEAAVVVHAAIDISPDNAICHFTLGNIYAVLSDYNKSVVCFENTLKLQSNSKNAEQRLRAVRCLSKLEKALEAHHNSLQRTLAELHDYQQQQEFCLKQQERMLSEQATAATKFEQQLHYENYKIRQSWDGKGQDCFQFEQNGHTILSCNMRREAYHQGLQSHVDLSLNLQLIQAVEARVVKAGQKVLGTKVSRSASDHCQHT